MEHSGRRSDLSAATPVLLTGGGDTFADVLETLLGAGVIAIVGPAGDAVAFADTLDDALRRHRSRHTRTLVHAAPDDPRSASAFAHDLIVGPSHDAEIVVTVGGNAPPVLYRRVPPTTRPPDGAAADRTVTDGDRHRATGPMEVAILGPTEIRGA